MKRKTFTEEEMTRLAANPYTFKVTPGQLSFTREFKERFWLEYREGRTPAAILRQCGYDPEGLGKRRVSGIRDLIKREADKPDGFQSGRRPARKRREDPPAGDAIQEIRHEIQYMRKELDFLKKVISLRDSL